MKNLRELTNLTTPETITEAPGMLRGSGSDERMRRAWFKRFEDQVDRLEQLVEGSELDEILKSGKFPATESKAMKDAFKKFQDEVEDLKMGLLSEFWEEDK